MSRISILFHHTLTKLDRVLVRGGILLDSINLPIKSSDLGSSHCQVRNTLSHTFVIETLGS